MNKDNNILNKNTLIIGITGSFGSGVTELSKLLEKEGFKLIKISNILHEEADNRNIKKEKRTRKTLQDIGNELRKKEIEKGEGKGGILIKKAFEKLNKLGSNVQEFDKIVIDSIKNPGEIYELREQCSNIYILGIDAPSSLRWERLKNSNEYKDNEQKFKDDDERDKSEEIYSEKKKILYGQEVESCIDLADVLINNYEDVDFEKETTQYKIFKQKILYLLNPVIKGPGSRLPASRELFMSFAYNSSLMSPCLKRQVGAVIIKSDAENRAYIVSNGYNSVAEGNENCITLFRECFRDKQKKNIDDVLRFCPLCGNKLSNDKVCMNINCKYSNKQTKIIDNITLSKGLDICPAVHAEQQAILQAAYLGSSSLKGATLFTTTFPCLTCANMIIQSGIRSLFFVDAYPDKYSKEALIKASIELHKFEGIKAQAYNKLFKKLLK